VRDVPGDDLESWHARVVEEHAKALERENQLYIDAGFDRPINPGDPYPVISDEYMEAGDRVAVLQHQLEDMRRRLGWTST
jgi:hypothetical protein